MNVNDVLNNVTITALQNATGRITSTIMSKTIGLTNKYYAEMDIDQELDSNNEREKLSGLKKLLSSISKGEDVSRYFAKVIKNIASNSFHVRKLVYIYLLKYAEQEPDLSLLSINTFQKDLSDPNPMIRTVALRVMSSIKVPLIIPIITLAFKKGTSDLSPYVRKAVAISLTKCYKMDPTQQPILVEIIQTLLNDKSTIVLGPVIAAMNEICPDRFDLLHKHFNKICKLLRETDEWGQIQILNFLSRYNRLHFVNPKGSAHLDPDFQLFLDTIKPLLYSRNPLVVLMVASNLYILDQSDLKEMSCNALIRCLTRPKQEQYFILHSIKELMLIDITPWHSHIQSFAVYVTESELTRNLKLEILDILLCESNSKWILSEFQSYVRSSCPSLAQKSIQCWRNFVTRIPSMALPTLQILISLLSSPNDIIIGEAIIMIRRLLQIDPDSCEKSVSHERLIGYLVSIYETITVSLASASILWLIGHHISTYHGAPDALRIALKTFAKEDSFLKRQIITLSCLLLLDNHINPKETKIANFIKASQEYCMKLARFDLDFDVRDHARLLESATKNVIPNPEKCSRLIAILTQTSPVHDLYHAKASGFRIESLSHFMNHEIKGYQPLTEWSESVFASEERKDEETSWNRDRIMLSETKPVKKSQKTRKRVVSLDDFYADEPEVVATKIIAPTILSEDEVTDDDTTSEDSESGEEES